MTFIAQTQRKNPSRLKITAIAFEKDDFSGNQIISIVARS